MRKSSSALTELSHIRQGGSKVLRQLESAAAVLLTVSEGSAFSRSSAVLIVLTSSNNVSSYEAATRQSVSLYCISPLRALGLW